MADATYSCPRCREEGHWVWLSTWDYCPECGWPAAHRIPSWREVPDQPVPGDESVAGGVPRRRSLSPRTYKASSTSLKQPGLAYDVDANPREARKNIEGWTR